MTEIYRRETQKALLDTDFKPAPEEIQRRALNEQGVFYTTEDNGKAASFYSGFTPASEQDHDKVFRLSQTDNLMKAIHDANPLVTSIYFNTWDSYNHIYPFFDTPSQYPADMDIPQYNFYYDADAVHNPERKVVWTDVYIDPAGQGWMTSAIAPVYRGNFLEGVVGLDITVQTIIQNIQNLNIPWEGYAILLNGSGNIMALPPQGEKDFGLSELTQHSYQEAIRQESFKPDQFNLYKRQDTQALGEQMRTQGAGHFELLLNGESKLVAWETIPETRWKLVTIVAEQAVYSKANELATRFTQIGYLLITGLVVFYLVFFAYMWRRSKSMSRMISQPLEALQQMVQAIGIGNYYQTAPKVSIHELQDTGDAISQMGHELGHTAEALQISENRLQLALESTTDTLWDLDIPQQRLFINHLMREKLGVKESQEYIELSTLDALIHPDDLRDVQQMRAFVVKGDVDLFEAEYRIKNAQDQWIWLQSRGKIVEHDAQGQPKRLVGTYVDISARKEAETQLRLAKETADAANRAKSQFLSSISHELRTPLNAILGFGQLLKADVSLPDSERGEYVGEILSAGDHLLHLIDDILDLSRIESNRMSLSIEPVDAVQVARQCTEMVRTLAQQHKVGVQGRWPEQSYMVQADHIRLRQVILNLLSNAIKYNRERGEVFVFVEQKDQRLRISVQDTGPGISLEQQAELFKPFNRLGYESSNVKGTGIGLTISRQLVTLMEGEINFVSQPGLGSTFWVELPLSGDKDLANLRALERVQTTANAEVAQSANIGRALGETVPRPQLDPEQLRKERSAAASPSIATPPPTTAKVTTEPQAPRAPKQVLYVEDNPANMRLIQHVVGMIEGCMLLSSDNAEEGLVLAQEQHPDLIILDINLPGMDGYQALEILKQDARTSSIPVIALTANAMEHDIERGMAAGFMAYHTKPIDVPKMVNVIKEIVNV
ncbi:PAS domain S-box-containing protein [Allopseudospirillum japonicum]|uniref:histidine kinase n=1 Tax=Allopseudospirillum japonicum TaxID=64971 RepID=A0A1H6RNI5_9GAMM|nr:ATP-binding protein [Allopseudospirillum japonicum]SEI54904.1 PAS domain S-box-containing protein [Allopseudospirillum japonicum]